MPNAAPLVRAFAAGDYAAARQLWAVGALRAEGIRKCHLLVFGHNAEGLAFWRAVGATERFELALFSIGTGRAT